MGYPLVPCRVCSKELEATQMDGEEALQTVVDGKILAVARNFRVTCPDHGMFIWQNTTGHHSTVNEKLLNEMIPPNTRSYVKSRLSKEERNLFKKACMDQYIFTREEYERWKALSQESLMENIKDLC